MLWDLIFQFIMTTAEEDDEVVWNVRPLFEACIMVVWSHDVLSHEPHEHGTQA